jgi:hypothetical protein
VSPSWWRKDWIEAADGADAHLRATVATPKRDGRFISQWLECATEAEPLLVELRAREPDIFRRVDSCAVVSFELIAICFLQRLLQSPNTVINMADAEAEDLAIFSELGFFQERAGKYRFAMPDSLKTTNIRQAIVGLAGTEDAMRMLHPARLLSYQNVQAFHLARPQVMLKDTGSCK